MAKIHEIENWIDGVKEEIIDPDIEIIDPHHHLWHGPEAVSYTHLTLPTKA